MAPDQGFGRPVALSVRGDMNLLYCGRDWSKILQQVSDVEVLACNAVFSLVLEEHCDTTEKGFASHNNAGVIIGGVECATLGHG